MLSVYRHCEWFGTDAGSSIAFRHWHNWRWLGDKLIELARLCSNNVLVPVGVGCCGFAGDKGFSNPEVNRYALRKLRKQIEEHKVVYGYSNSRTCEIGLQTNSGVPYMSIAYLVNECTTPKAWCMKLSTYVLSLSGVYLMYAPFLFGDNTIIPTKHLMA